MSDRSDTHWIEDILESIRRTVSYVNGMSQDEFMADTKTQDAVLRNLEVIGEAAKKVSQTTQDNLPNVPWRLMSRTRDRLIHHYFGVNLDIVWTVASVELPKVQAQLEGADLSAD